MFIEDTNLDVKDKEDMKLILIIGGSIVGFLIFLILSIFIIKCKLTDKKK